MDSNTITTNEPPYRDSPPSSRSPSPQRTPPSRASTAKPSTNPTTNPTQFEPYRDDPTEQPTTHLTPSPSPPRRPTISIPTHPHNPPPFPSPYTDTTPTHANDVPLAHLYTYPPDAPPSYDVVVRESFRETLVPHLPRGSSHSTNNGDGDVDEEAGVEVARVDDVRFTVERVVAAVIVSMALVVVAALLALFAVLGVQGRGR